MSIQEQIPIDGKRWYAVQCKFRCEKTLMIELKAQDIETYVPIQQKLRQYKSRKKVSETALIPSHVFVSIDRSQYLMVLRHHHVFRFLNFSGILNPIPQKEMDLMRRVVGEFESVLVDSTSYSVGDRVQIIGGELTGLEGELLNTNNHNFKIELASLGMGLMIFVDPKHLLKIGSQKKVA